MRELISLILVATGAFFYWMLSGFKTKFNNYMSGQHEANAKYYKNWVTGMVIYTVILSIIIKVIS